MGVKTIRRDIGKFGMQSLTSYQVNRNGVRRQAIRRGTAEAAGMNHSQAIKSTRPKQAKKCDTRFNWTWHGSTYPLTNKIRVKRAIRKGMAYFEVESLTF